MNSSKPCFSASFGPNRKTIIFERHFLKASGFHPLQHPNSLISWCFEKMVQFLVNSSKPSALFIPNTKMCIFERLFLKGSFFTHFNIQAAWKADALRNLLSFWWTVQSHVSQLCSVQLQKRLFLKGIFSKHQFFSHFNIQTDQKADALRNLSNFWLEVKALILSSFRSKRKTNILKGYLSKHQFFAHFNI